MERDKTLSCKDNLCMCVRRFILERSEQLKVLLGLKVKWKGREKQTSFSRNGGF